MHALVCISMSDYVCTKNAILVFCAVTTASVVTYPLYIFIVQYAILVEDPCAASSDFACRGPAQHSSALRQVHS